jgi:Transposase IS116/IS110/IS902 family
MLRLVLLYAIPEVHRFPRGQDVVSSCRLGQGAKASAGQRDGTSGAKIGKAHLTGAFAEAAVLVLRDHPAAQQYLARLAKKHAQGQALTILAQKLARAVYARLKRHGAFEREQCFPRYTIREGSG